MNRPGQLFLAALLALPGGPAAAQAPVPPLAPSPAFMVAQTRPPLVQAPLAVQEGTVAPEGTVQGPVQSGEAPPANQEDAVTPAPRLSLSGLTRWTPLTNLTGNQDLFELNAAAGTSVTLSQVSSTVFELSSLEVTGLGNAGNAALEQELRANFRALADLGQSQSRTVQLTVRSRTAAGTELLTRWSDPALVPAPSSAGTPDVQLTQWLLPGGLSGPVQVSSTDPQQAARFRLLGSSELDRLSPLAGAPYGTARRAGERVSGVQEQALLPLFAAVLGPVTALGEWSLPSLSGANLPPLELRLERVYQGQNSRGDHLFQTQGRAQPWQQSLEAGGSRLTLEVPDSAQMSQAVYRADGLPHSAFEFSTLQLQVTAQQGAAQVRFTVQVRTTSALRPAGG